MTQIPAITDKNSLISAYIKDNEFDHFTFKFVNSNLKLDCAETHSELVSVMKIAGLCKRVNDKIDVTNIVANMPALVKAAKAEECWVAKELRSVVQTIHEISFPDVEERVKSGWVKFLELPFILRNGMDVVATEGSSLFGGVVNSTKIVNSYNGTFLNVSISIILATENGRSEAQKVVSLPYYDGIIDASKLRIHAITDAEKEALTNRGRIFEKFTRAPTPVGYKGALTIPSWFGDTELRADGRIMVDTKTFRQMEPDGYRNMIREKFSVKGSNDFDDDGDNRVDFDKVLPIGISENHLWRCYHRIPGFAMRLKMWGWVDVAGMSDVVWRDDAFQNLVLPDKDRIFHLVKHYGASFGDFIDDKSGGLIFLLHGPTGMGKTLTAEAVAESLRRPLYSISMGELGTTVVQMEKTLRNILDLAHQWNAVLLLDEADIFMEARDTNDVERNAMVSIFLRILEYHSGVMFLTTNRVKAFDPAFFSRISVALKYENMNAEGRKTIWKNLLGSAKIEDAGFNLDTLAKYEINGRNMKTAVRLAQTTALGYDRPVTQEDIEDVLKSSATFNKEIGIY